jgi:peptidyl-prolyl cis-trans isomerase C
MMRPMIFAPPPTVGRRAGRRRQALLAAALVVAIGCQRQEKVLPPDVIATLDHEQIRYDTFAAHLATTLGDQGGTLAAPVLSQLLDQYLDELLLRRLAVAQGLMPPSASGKAAANALLAKESAGAVASDEEVAAYYAGHTGDFTRPERVHLRQILVDKRELAEQALRRIRAGTDFAAVAASLSVEPRANAGGDQGELTRDDLPPAFVDTIFALAPGAVSDVVAADYGFLIFQVLSHSEAETISLTAATPEIRATLDRQRADRLLADLLTRTRAAYQVRVLAGNLPFAYQGTYAASTR